ncbi:hypothetical protein Y032_0010g901 [Ancylostoma ceylanicum]|uniref:Uncharacterized protein n=1 Tax=Ancylostoma ceylanicum TaxID=53326 RepID=A0A016VHB1_9BILA|nr:hypothetical protein Y032_0010g901 [Ancylostoma ceylanicum]
MSDSEGASSNSFDLDLDAIYLMHRIDRIDNVIEDIIHRVNAVEARYASPQASTKAKWTATAEMMSDSILDDRC